jgi:hypothetical protein
MTDDIRYSKKGKRELSPFITKEMLFDYEIGALDEERVRSLESALKHSQDLRSELQRVKLGLKFFSDLSILQPKKNLYDKAIVPNSFSYRVMKLIKFEDWPDVYRWALEASLASIAIFLIAVVVPWHKLLSMVWNRSTQVILSEYQKSESEPMPTTTTMVLAAANLDKSREIIKPESLENNRSAPVKTETVNSSVEAKIPQGYLYRGTASVGKLAIVNSQLISKLNELGALKAGQADLGRLKERSSYFHFRVLEEKLDEVKMLFESMGSLTLTKERHERVMPEGVVRIIIEVKEEPEQNESDGVDSSDSAQSVPANQR